MNERVGRRRAALATAVAALLVAAAACTGSTPEGDGASATSEAAGATSVLTPSTSEDPTPTSLAATTTTVAAGSPSTTGALGAALDAAAPSTSITAPGTDTAAGTATADQPDPSGTGQPSTDGVVEPAGIEPIVTVDPLVALQSVDWRNDWYSVFCPGPERTGVQLVDGEYRPERGHLRALGDLLYGEIDLSWGGRRQVAAVEIICIGASHFPSTWLLYGAEPDGTVVELGVVAPGEMRVAATEPPYWWEAYTGVFVDGLLHLRGSGYSPAAAHCCPNYDVYAAFALGPDGPVEVAHHEVLDVTVPTLPTTPPTSSSTSTQPTATTS